MGDVSGQGIMLSDDEVAMVMRFRKTKKMIHAHGEWDVKDGKIIKLWITEKIDLDKIENPTHLVEVERC